VKSCLNILGENPAGISMNSASTDPTGFQNLSGRFRGQPPAGLNLKAIPKCFHDGRVEMLHHHNLREVWVYCFDPWGSEDYT
jgi:hypothetical protein